MTRACTQNVGSYCEIFVSDSECSDVFEDASSGEEDESHDATKEQLPEYDDKRGEDSWVGRRIVKKFGDYGDFEGIVYGVDEDTDNEGYRLFLCYYFDDPEDAESMWPDELMR